ncbi:hypothetical protein SNE40_001297 [Patella caerulea]|uniref:HAT C-terminal dimerisation domain-containing protein n=1 Tax=Patella caerulea TaxID=87958 RepID=A0AAN8KC71_PATCE
MAKRLVDTKYERSLKDLDIFVPNRWSEPDQEVPYFEGEERLLALCERFNFPQTGAKAAFREFCHDPIHPPDLIRNMINGLQKTIPISSAEAERGFSIMNLILTPLRNCLLIVNLSSLMFISMNGPPTHIWDSQQSVTKWLSKHRDANDTRSRVHRLETLGDLNPVQAFFARR